MLLLLLCCCCCCCCCSCLSPIPPTPTLASSSSSLPSFFLISPSSSSSSFLLDFLICSSFVFLFVFSAIYMVFSLATITHFNNIPCNSKNERFVFCLFVCFVCFVTALGCLYNHIHSSSLSISLCLLVDVCGRSPDIFLNRESVWRLQKTALLLPSWVG